MTANREAVFVDVPKPYHVRISTANTVRNGSSGTMGTLVTAGANGSRVDRIVITATGTTTAGMIRFFLDDGASVRAFMEVAVTAVTPTASAPAFTAEVVRTDGQAIVELASGWSLKCATHNAEEFDVTVPEGGDY